MLTLSIAVGATGILNVTIFATVEQGLGMPAEFLSVLVSVQGVAQDAGIEVSVRAVARRGHRPHLPGKSRVALANMSHPLSIDVRSCLSLCVFVATHSDCPTLVSGSPGPENQDGTGKPHFATGAVLATCRFRITPEVGACIRCNRSVHEPDTDWDEHGQWWLLRRLSKKGCKRISCAVPRRCEEETGSDRLLRSMSVLPSVRAVPQCSSARGGKAVPPRECFIRGHEEEIRS
jgi:hypothetical protein